ncbi:MAG TPA: DUF4190 domain-containing protein [Dermatophilaceae bacterium]|nr:DUF4190 domain-containing protein [Dermatophilaceae bacterium]
MAALVLGILSILSSCLWFIGGVLGVLAVVLGFIALRKARAGQASGAGLAKGGLVTGVVGLVLSLVLLVAGVALLSRFGDCANLPTPAEQQQCVRDRAN